MTRSIIRPALGVESWTAEAEAAAGALASQLQHGLDTSDADAYDAWFGSDILWGNPRGGTLAGFVELNAIHHELMAVEWLRGWTLSHPDDPVAVVHDRAADSESTSSLREVEQRLARRDLAWHAATGQRVVHWGGTAHVVAGDPRTVAPDQTHPNAGGLMRRELGRGYAVLALTAGSGTAPFPVPGPPVDFTEHAFTTVEAQAAMIDLAVAASGPDDVRTWLCRPLRTRMIGPTYDSAHDHDARVDAGPVTDAVDVFIHLPHIDPGEPLRRPAGAPAG